MTSSVVLPDCSGAVLVASPNPELRDRVLRNLERRGPVQVATGGAEALAKLESGHWQMLLLDRRLPDLDSEELVEVIERRYPGIRVVMVDSALNDGPIEGASTKVAARSSSSEGRAEILGQTLETCLPVPGMIGNSEAMRQVYRLLRLVAGHHITVLITGPTGSGKELAARAIHQLSPRAANHFSVLNCAALPETLVESELFGYARGAFTGALQTYAGRILAAQGGTLFLDEVGELAPAAQAKLLRFLEAKEVQRLGSTETTRVDVRIVAATNRDLGGAVRHGEFREDLYYRLSSFPIALPALSERSGDLPELAHYFLELLAPARRLRFDRGALEKLAEHSWPGNVRELQQALERAVILAGAREVILPEDLQFSESPACARKVA